MRSTLYKLAIVLALPLVACSDDDVSPIDGSVASDSGVKFDAAADGAAKFDAPVVTDGAVDVAVGGDARDGAPGDAAVVDGGGKDGGVGDGGLGDGGVVACLTPGPTCAPVLGSQIDRMGRPGVNTALTDPFWDNGTTTAAEHHAKQDKYNQASDPALWGDVELVPGTKAKDAIRAALGAYDSLDGTSDGVAAGDGCGNQLAFGATYKGTKFSDYSLLTTVLTDDRLYVNTSTGVCTTYLGVEANELGIANQDCGGRTPGYNTIDVTFSALVTGHAVCTNNCEVSSGIRTDGDIGAGYSEATFPFMGAPL